jgi:hypothetical protein
MTDYLEDDYYSSNTNQNEGLLNPGYRPDIYYSYPGIINTSRRNDGSAANYIYLNFVYLPSRILKNLAIYVRDTVEDTSRVKLGIYNTSYHANKKIAENIIPISSESICVSTFNLRLTKGWYAFAYLSNKALSIQTIHHNYFTNKKSVYGMDRVMGNSQTGFKYSRRYEEGLPEVFDPDLFPPLNCQASPYIEYNFQ